MQLAHGQSLDQYEKLENGEVKSIFKELFDTVHYLHSKNICHRDLKPDNIIYDAQTKTLKLIDFNVATKIGKDSGEIRGATGLKFWSAPETRTAL